MKITKRQRRAAAKLPGYLRHVATTKARRPAVSGTFGAASEARSLTPDEITAYRTQQSREARG